MEPAVRDFLAQLCESIEGISQDVERWTEGDTSPLLLTEQDEGALRELLQDGQRGRLCLRLARHAATAAVFNMLVLFDEQRRLGVTGAAAKLSLMVGDMETAPPSYLHELLGDVMHDLGMETDEWW